MMLHRCAPAQGLRMLAQKRAIAPLETNRVAFQSLAAIQRLPAASLTAQCVGGLGAVQTTQLSASEPPATAISPVVEAPGSTNTLVKNIIFITSEVSPWSKTGGLADVCGSLPPALAARGYRVMVVSPRYENYPDAIDTAKHVDILGAEVGYFHHRFQGVDWVFVDHPSYPRPGGIYGDKFGTYGDNQFRYKLLCVAALEAPLQLTLEGSLYGEDCVFVANDWHASLVPVYLAAKYRPYGVYRDARSILAIHNLRHQGVFPPGTYAELGLPSEWYAALEWQYPPEQRLGSWEEQGRAVNHLKAGITTADRILTVSPGYAEEIQTWLGGCGMDGLLASRQPVLDGVVNGIAMSEWDPATDKHITHTYSSSDITVGKQANKLALQKELGLPEDFNVPLVAFIGRLDYQKGADLVLEVAPWLIVEEGVQLVCLGTGDSNLEDGLRWLESSFPHAARGWVGFNVPFSHRLTAAADILLMPSRFEPCGLNQLYAMRYGTVPIAHKTGGLKDTVLDFDPFADQGTGWTFSECNAGGLKHALGLALRTMRDHPDDFQAIQRRGMLRDSSWDQAAQDYLQIFEWSKIDPVYCK